MPIDNQSHGTSPGTIWDGERLTRDGAFSPPPERKKHPMAKPKLNLRNLTRLERIALAGQIHAGITGNPDYATPHPTLVDLQAAIDAVNTSAGELDAIQQSAREKTVEVDGLDLALSDILRGLSAYV